MDRIPSNTWHRNTTESCVKMYRPGVPISTVVTRFLRAALCMGVWSFPGAAQAQKPPPIYAYPAVYHLIGGHWERTLVLHSGDQARWILLFLAPGQPAWGKPSGHLVVRRDVVPLDAQPAIYRAAMRRQLAPHGYQRFSLTARVGGSRWLGRLVAEFKLRTSGGMTSGAFLSFKVVSP